MNIIVLGRDDVASDKFSTKLYNLNNSFVNFDLGAKLRMVNNFYLGLRFEHSITNFIKLPDDLSLINNRMHINVLSLNISYYFQ